MSDLVKGLLISGIGMGLVFVVIIMLWGVMAGLVRLTSGTRKKKGDAEGLPVTVREGEAGGDVVEGVALKRKAAAIAVAYALGAQIVQPGRLTHERTTNEASSWLAAGRARQMSDQSLRGRR
jgi:Na+-transporting methylmalonyl-CoA/oxaloacetate decarboxylase gamma subunit